MTESEDDEREEPVARPWIDLKTTYDVAAGIDSYKREPPRFVEKNKHASGYGICFCLGAGGEIFMHTTPEGDVWLDVTPEADWVTPVIEAATLVSAPSSQIWILSGQALTPLVLGLSSLIDSTRFVLQHDFKQRKMY